MQETLIETAVSPATKQVGRPRLKPSEEQRQLAREMTARGISQDDIAKHLSISAPTLRKHFRAELNADQARDQEPTVTP
jgi:DNA invertase Pin-like site-specific DNA recombinase